MEWLMGIDDTDLIDTPGTNKLARHLARLLAPLADVRMLVRHQLLIDPRIPYTSHNGAASFLLDVSSDLRPDALADRVRPIIREWCPPGSDPGLCIATSTGHEIVAFAQRCQRNVVSPHDAFVLAERCGIHLEAVGGTGDGVIGALAAVGLLATRNDGRVLHRGDIQTEPFALTGCQGLTTVLERGVAEVLDWQTGRTINSGSINVGKRLRPNLREGRVVLYVQPAEFPPPDGAIWDAVKIA